MKAKIIIVAVVLVIIVAAAYVFTNNSLTTSSNQNIVTNADASQVSTLVDNGYSDIIQDQMNSLSIEQPAFMSQTQDSMASDLSQFYYS
jgi:uncharacterized protein YxeA